jgi:hypothetical protein
MPFQVIRPKIKYLKKFVGGFFIFINKTTVQPGAHFVEK